VKLTGTLLPTKVTMMSSMYDYKVLRDAYFDLLYLYLEGIITLDEHDRLVKMFSSADRESHVVATLALESFKKQSREKGNPNYTEVK
jgi:hypothetical protein